MVGTAAVVMANPSVRLSVRPSVKRVDCDKTKEPPANFLIPYERSIHPIYRHEESLVGVIPLYLKFWDKLTDPLQKRRLPTYIRS